MPEQCGERFEHVGHLGAGEAVPAMPPDCGYRDQATLYQNAQMLTGYGSADDGRLRQLPRRADGCGQELIKHRRSGGMADLRGYRRDIHVVCHALDSPKLFRCYDNRTRPHVWP